MSGLRKNAGVGQRIDGHWAVAWENGRRRVQGHVRRRLRGKNLASGGARCRGDVDRRGGEVHPPETVSAGPVFLRHQARASAMTPARTIDLKTWLKSPP